MLIAGPTASGKSALALALAGAASESGRPALVVNADSMQVYADLRVLSARPSAADEARVPHRLYGHVSGAEAYSAGRWLADVGPVLREAEAGGALPILVGGTGLYFRALAGGLSEIPAVPEPVRRRWRSALAEAGPAALYGLLAARDPEMAARLRPSDPQRIVRALEVLEATGRSLAAFQAGGGEPLLAGEGVARFVLEPDRAVLRCRIGARVEAMLAGGAVEEVASLLARRLPPELPVMKAIGVREIGALLAGSLARPEAAEAMNVATRQYAKRQATWFRNQMPGWRRVRPA
ncbi:tRNA (adenosine(37)-N6)-dimethylallyltransferase MiaA [Rhizobiales bacterium L72]|uniref:tRNA dimethylallyltransferase n=1 Tax=Propylenella binzhouense TaxID=2555902 RepID=A0A964T783_9HYPH|nr:tRNA (adenosine(37)-N6)-dimethylallyltransferase MiaA [Propylenella binzhouense]